MSDTQPLLAFALELADEADRVSMGFYRGELGTEAKADGSLVTLADKAVEARLRELILARYPEHAILGEEQGHTPGASGTRWIIDPIDGTHGFTRGQPVWASLIAVEVDGRIEAGVASAPALGTRWWAGRGLGAYRGATGTRSHAGERIHVSSVARLDAAQVLYGSWRYQADRWPGFEALVRSAWRSRGYGDFWQHCLVAEGAAEVALEGDISPWDIAALVVILEEAGGRLTDDRGVPTIDAGHCVTSNGALHEETLRVLLGGAATTGAGW